MGEVYLEVIRLWLSGGQRGVDWALGYLERLGWEPKQAKEQLLGAIQIYRGQDEK